MSLPVPSLPSGNSPFTLYGNNTQITLPNTFDSDRESQGGTSYTTPVEGLDGGIRTRLPALNPVEISLSGIILDSPTADDLRTVLGGKRITLQRDNRTLDCDLTSYRVKETNTGSVWRVEISLFSTQGYWLGTWNESAANPSTITYDGHVITYPTLVWTGGTGGATEVTATMNSKTATWTGALGSGEELLIDCNRFTASLDGTNVLGGMNGAFFTSPPELRPGSNAITISVTGSADLSIWWRGRYM